MLSRLSIRDLFIVVAILTMTPVASFVVTKFCASGVLGATIAAGIVTVSSFTLIALIDWAIWKDDKKERVKTNNAVRQWELTHRKVLGETSSARSARWWWWPVYSWWLKQRYRENT